MTVRDPMSLPNPFEAAGSNIPLPGAHASVSDEPRTQWDSLPDCDQKL
jgi:hypothetical protein